jgi:hypothetical protein
VSLKQGCAAQSTLRLPSASFWLVHALALQWTFWAPQYKEKGGPSCIALVNSAGTDSD